jgi:tetratricopeptide (TPR) repeat protein
MIRFAVFLSIAFFICHVAFGQTGFSQYFHENTLPAIDNDTYPKLDFAWNMSGKVQSLMNNGITELEEGDPTVAVRDFSDVIKLQPTFLPAFYYRGVAYKKLYDLKKAEEDFMQVIVMNPKTAEAFVMLGEIDQERFFLAKATVQYEKALALMPSLVRAYYNLGTIEAANNNTRKANKYFEKCHEVDPHFADAYLMQGLLKYALIKKKNSEAMMYFNQALQQDSTHRETLFWRGLSYVMLDQPQKGIADWNKLVLYNPNNTYFLRLRGFLNIDLQDFDQAYNDLRKAVLSNRENEDRYRRGEIILDHQMDVEYATEYAMRFSYGLDEGALAYFKKGFCFFLANQKKKAIENFNAAARIQPSATVFFLKAVTYEHLGEHDSAHLYYDKALALDNEIIDAHKKRALYRFELKNWKGTYADLNEMSRLQPDLLLTYRLRGLIKIEQKDYYGAIIDFSRYLKVDTADHDMLVHRALCRTYIKDFPGANDDLGKTLRYHPDDKRNTVVYERMTDNYLSVKDTVNALGTLRRYLKAMPEESISTLWMAELFVEMEEWDSAQVKIDRTLRGFHPVYHNKTLYSRALGVRGRVLLNRKDFKGAITAFTTALEINPANMEARYHRGKTYIAKGEKRNAIEDFRKLQAFGYHDADVILQSLESKSK